MSRSYSSKIFIVAGENLPSLESTLMFRSTRSPGVKMWSEILPSNSSGILTPATFSGRRMPPNGGDFIFIVDQSGAPLDLAARARLSFSSATFATRISSPNSSPAPSRRPAMAPAVPAAMPAMPRPALPTPSDEGSLMPPLDITCCLWTALFAGCLAISSFTAPTTLVGTAAAPLAT